MKERDREQIFNKFLWTQGHHNHNHIRNGLSWPMRATTHPVCGSTIIVQAKYLPSMYSREGMM